MRKKKSTHVRKREQIIRLTVSIWTDWGVYEHIQGDIVVLHNTRHDLFSF